MKSFAKLFGPEGDQILVLREQNERSGKPEVRVYFQPANPNLSLCHKAATFSDSEAGELQANLVFSQMTEEAARKFIADALATTE